MGRTAFLYQSIIITLLILTMSSCGSSDASPEPAEAQNDLRNYSGASTPTPVKDVQVNPSRKIPSVPSIPKMPSGPAPIPKSAVQIPSIPQLPPVGGLCANDGPGGPAYDGPGGPAYDGPLGPCDDGPGGACSMLGNDCPKVCSCKN